MAVDSSRLVPDPSAAQTDPAVDAKPRVAPDEGKAESAALAFALSARDRADVTVSGPGDAVEREADAVAPGAGRASTADPQPAADAPDAVREGVESPGRPLGAGEARGVPGVDPAAVRVHTGERASASARAFGAAAYTVGDDIVVGDGYRPNTASGRRLITHELAHVGQVRARPGPPLVRRDLAVPPTKPNAAPVLSDAAAADAAAFNARTITDPAEIGMLRDILGLDPAPAVVDADFSRAVATYQGGYGLTPDGKVGPVTRRRLSNEILAESATLPAAGLGDLSVGLQLRTDLTALIAAGNRTYADYRARILTATVLQKDVCLADTAFLTQLRGQLAWNDFARCVELFGRRAPTFAELTANATVTAALGAAWTASTPGVNPPVAGQHEEGGWVFLNLITNAITTRRQAAGAGAAINLAAPPIVADSIVVAKFHTHPNLGPAWLATPSPQDATVDAAHGVPDIVVGTAGVDPLVFTTFASGPDSRVHLAGGQGLPGAAGGLAPQAKIDESHDEQ